MKDRQPTQPGRVKITPEDGSPAYFANMEMADEPIEPGTPLNKDNLLKDTTAALFGLPDSSVPDEVLQKIATMLNAMSSSKRVKCKYGFSYIGRYQELTITLGVRPFAVMLILKENYEINWQPQAANGYQTIKLFVDVESSRFKDFFVFNSNGFTLKNSGPQEGNQIRYLAFYEE